MENLTEKIEQLARKIAQAHQHTLIIGPSGAGKTMIARQVVRYLAKPTTEEFSVIGRIANHARLRGSSVNELRPFRAPHHTASMAGMFGRAPDSMWIPTFGECTLAHLGVLFLDELPEFQRSVLEQVAVVIRNDSVIHGTKIGNVTYPASFLLVAAMNPCPCGYGVGNHEHRCTCTSEGVKRHKVRIDCLQPLFSNMIDLRTT